MNVVLNIYDIGHININYIKSFKNALFSTIKKMKNKLATCITKYFKFCTGGVSDQFTVLALWGCELMTWDYLFIYLFAVLF